MGLTRPERSSRATPQEAARDSGPPMPAGTVLPSPWLDFDDAGRLLRRGIRDPFIPSRWPTLIARTLVLANEPDQAQSPPTTNWRGSLRRSSKSGAPSSCIPNSARLARALAQAGVEARLQVWEGQIHDFQMTADVNPDARAAIRQIAAFALAVAAAD